MTWFSRRIPIAISGAAVLFAVLMAPTSSNRGEQRSSGDGEFMRLSLSPATPLVAPPAAGPAHEVTQSSATPRSSPVETTSTQSMDALSAISNLASSVVRLASLSPAPEQAPGEAQSYAEPETAPADKVKPTPTVEVPQTPSEAAPENGMTEGDWNPAFPPLPPTIAPPDGATARLAIAAYRKGDTAVGDAYAATATTDVGRAALEWAAIETDARGTGFARVMDFLKAHPDWPVTSRLHKRSEEALYAGKEDYGLLSAYFAKAEPESAQGKLALARLDRKEGHIDQATSLVREVWRMDELGPALESKVLAEFGDLLTAEDHKFRADRAFYKEDVGRLLRAAALVGPDEVALAKAQVAVIGQTHNAEAMLAALPLKTKADPSFIFARIQWLRRTDKPDNLMEAASLMLTAPRDPAVIVDGDAWWIERRLIARKLLDMDKAEEAYEICAEHSAESTELRIEAEFHAGWIALRFLDNPTLAAPHFAAAAAVAAMPASIARAAYWQGRTAEALGDAAAASASYLEAAQQVTTYYGQLAREKLNLTDLPLRETTQLAAGDDRALVIRVVEFLYAIDEADLAFPLVKAAAKRMSDPGQMAALGKVVEDGRDARAALKLGKIATQRGFALDDLAFPIFGIPYYQPVPKSADKTVVYAIARQESAFAPTATSTAGAQGLMQLMPDTARRAAKDAGIALDMAKLNSDGALNARIGAAHLGELMAEEGNSYILTFAAYNAGGKRVKEWIDAHGDPRKRDVDPVDWIELIPITETRDYVQRVIENLQVYRVRFGEATKLINEAGLRKAGGG